MLPWGALGPNPTVADYQRLNLPGYWTRESIGEDYDVEWIPLNYHAPGYPHGAIGYESPYGDIYGNRFGNINDPVKGDRATTIFSNGVEWFRIGEGENLLGPRDTQEWALMMSQRVYDPAYGYVVPANLARRAALEGADVDPQDRVASYAPLILATLFTAGAASGAFSAVAVAESGAGAGTLAAELGAEAAAAETAAEFGAAEAAAEFGLEETAAEFGAAEFGLEETIAEFGLEEFATSYEVVEPLASAPASSTMSIPPDVMPSPPPAGGGFSMPSVSQIAQKALPLALKALTKSGGAPVAGPRTVSSPQPLYLTGPDATYLTDYKNNRMLWGVGGTLAALGLLFITQRQRKGKRS